MKSPPPARGPPATTGVRGGAPSVPTASNSLHSPAPLLPLLNRQTPEKQAFCGVCPHDFLFSPSRSALYCTISAPFKSQDAYNSASRPSANTVGYTVKEQQSGAYSKVACFDGIAVENMDIQDIVPQAPAGEDLYTGAFTIMTLTSDTATDKNYFYFTAEDAAAVDGVAKAGWFNEDMDTRLTDVVFTPGEGFLVVSDFDDATVTFAGAVAQGDTIVELSAGANFCGNNALQALDMQSITVGSDCDESGNLSWTSEEAYTGCFTIMTLTSDTATDKNYFWFTAADAEAVDGIAEAGWFNEDMDTRMTGDNAVSFDAGEGFLLISDFDTAYAKIPGNPAL